VSRNPEKTGYGSGEHVTVTATAAEGYTFAGWSGDTTGTANPISITMNGNKTVIANFTESGTIPGGETYTLTTSVNPVGSGTVLRNPGKASYEPGEEVTVTATANSGYSFAGWTGALSSTDISVSVTMNGDLSLTANYVENITPKTYTITFHVNGAGGTVTPTSMTTDADGKLLSLPTPVRSGYSFSGWYTAEAGGTEVTASTAFSGSTMIYARWTAESTPNNCTGAGACKTVEIGGQLWLAENLNIEMANSWCYDNNPDSCAKYGRLYTYAAAVSACELLGSGWHLPSRSEWQELVRAVDPNAKLIGDYDNDNVAGAKLKSTSGNGTDTYGFSALPGGCRYASGNSGYSLYAGTTGYWWTATMYGTNAYRRGMGYLSDNVNEDQITAQLDFSISVRCRKD
jgi:uncharacterized protein (TIGR02145 family)/uncharacterized repeat protein (TIGR02543 family)